MATAAFRSMFAFWMGGAGIGGSAPPVEPEHAPWASGSDTVGPMYRRPNDDDDVLMLFML